MKKNTLVYPALLLSLCGYLFIGYFLNREQYVILITTYALLFGVYFYLMRHAAAEYRPLFLSAALLFRTSFLFSLPALSDDYYRFLWDGEMINLLHNPFTVLPNTFILHSNQMNDYLEQLYAHMNSQTHYTVYPPLLQFMFAIAAWIGHGNLLAGTIVLRLFCIAADAGTIWLLNKLLIRLRLPAKNIWVFALNPLVIIELTGNLHFEGVMIFFWLLCIYLFYSGSEKIKATPALRSGWQVIASSASLALAVSSKLIPLLMAPFLIKRLKGIKPLVRYGLAFSITTVLLFLPFLDHQLLFGLQDSLGLYFNKFEFNASIYYLIRWAGYLICGYDVIQSVTPWLALLVFLSIVIIAWKEQHADLLHLFLMGQWALTIYLLLSTTVHPWYLTPLLMFGVFTGYRFAIVWSLFAVLSYATYRVHPYHEILWLTAIEYVVVGVMLFKELKSTRRGGLTDTSRLSSV